MFEGWNYSVKATQGGKTIRQTCEKLDWQATARANAYAKKYPKAAVRIEPLNPDTFRHVDNDSLYKP